MEKGLKEIIEELIESRTSKVICEIGSDEEFKKLQQSITIIQKGFVECKDEKLERLFLQYEDKVNHQYKIIADKLYRRAFSDAIEIIKRFNSLEP